MRKIITTVSLAAAALGTAAVLAAPAKAAVSYDATHDGVVTGHIDKPDVQAALGGLSENQIQNTPVTFTTTFQTFTDTSWISSVTGERVHNVKTLTFEQTLTMTEVRTGAGQKIKAWDLTGLGGLKFVGQTVTGPAIYSNFAGGLNVAQDHALGDSIKVNGVDLPETPIAVVPTA